MTEVGDVPLRRVIKLGARGVDVLAVRRALSDAGLIPWPPGGFDKPWHQVEGPLMARAVRGFQKQQGILRNGEYGEATHKLLLKHFDAYGAMLMRSFKPQPAAGEVTLSPSADRPEVHTQPEVIEFMRKVSAIWGRPITITTGTNHKKLTASNNVSEHWTGHAADVAMVGADLISIGRAALVAAGWSPKQASGRSGGLINVPRAPHGRYQIIFNTDGPGIGDHTTHLHVGISGG